MKDDKFCSLCRSCLYEDKEGGYVCHNENSVMYGEFLSDIRNEDCDKYCGGKYKDMSLKDACRIITQIGYISYFYQLPGRDHKPFLALTFESNEQAADWKDALTRLFGEYLELARKDGDFEEDQ